MAYFSQDQKKSKTPAIKAICKKYGIKASMAVRHNSTLVLNVKEGKIDFIKNFNETCTKSNHDRMFQPVTNGHIQVNPYWYHEQFSGESKEFLREVLEAMNEGNHDNSNSQIDYTDVGWYIDINIGQWDKPYKMIG